MEIQIDKNRKGLLELGYQGRFEVLAAGNPAVKLC